MPFGEEIGVNTPQTTGRGTHSQYITDNVRQKFTGYERDIESGLDYAQARMYGNAYGRFTSPDPIAGKIVFPQSHNKYVYVENNPLKYIDPTGETLVINGSYAYDLMAELQQSTGLKLSRCTEVNKKAGCNQIGQILIVGTVGDGKGASKKLAALLRDVIALKDRKGNDVTVTFNTTKHDPKNWIDRFSSRTVDVGDLQQIRNAGGGNFVAGQLGHFLAEYGNAAYHKANDPNYVDTDENGNPSTHDSGLAMESAVMSELDGDNYGVRSGGYVPDYYKGEREIVYIYNGEKNSVGYIFNLEVDSKKNFIYNITKDIGYNVRPRNPKKTQVPR